jgi:hypothetical protein
LLRHLGDARGLRRNPLVRQAIGAELCDDELTNGAQAFLDRALAAMDTSASAIKLRHRVRHMAILLRCDVLRESRAVVARDLGLSLPQFERERRIAMARLLESVDRIRPGTPPRVQSVRSGLARTVCDRAVRLADSGDHRSAVTLLDDVTRTASVKDKIKALTCMSEIATSDHATHRSRAALDAASRLLCTETLDDSSSALQLALEAASLRLQVVEQGPGAAASSLRARDDVPRRPESIALLVAQAEVFDGCGMVKMFGPLVTQAAALLSDAPDVDSALRIDLAFLQCQLNFWLDPAAKGRSGLEEAISAARAAGYAGRAAFAELSCLGGRWARTHDGNTRRTYRAQLEWIGSVTEFPRQTRFFAYWDAADIECAIGDPWRAADAARNALVLAPNAQRELLMKGLLARAHARGGRLLMAERIAREIVDPSGRVGAGMALLFAKRTLAYLASAAGRSQEMWEHLSDAAELARRYGTARLASELEDRLSAFRKYRAPSVSIVF